MSFLGGAECSTAGNPLSQFTKHVQDDKSLQRDRLVGRGLGSLQGMRSTGMNGSQDSVSFTFLPHADIRVPCGKECDIYVGGLADLILDDERIPTTRWPTSTFAG